MDEFHWVAVALVTVLSSARLTRLLTYDKFPPVQYLRDRYAVWTDKTPGRLGWQLLAFCAYCMSFWVTGAVLLLGWYFEWPVAWWLANSILGASYLSAIVVTFDGDDSEDEALEDFDDGAVGGRGIDGGAGI